MKIESNTFCYNNVFSTDLKGPTTAQWLVMFRENFVEHKCKVYASLSSSRSLCDTPERKDLPQGGLYEVTDAAGSCVTFRLLYEDDTLGQIVASSQFDPIEIIGVSGLTIYGYYPDRTTPGGKWLRKPTVWGDATDGTLTVEPARNGDNMPVSGLSSNGRVSTFQPRNLMHYYLLDNSQSFLSYFECSCLIYGVTSTTLTTQNTIASNAQLAPQSLMIGQGFSPGHAAFIVQSKATLN